jgi:phosphatidylinositol 4-kinase
MNILTRYELLLVSSSTEADDECLKDNPTYVFCSEKMDLTLELTDDYSARNQMLRSLQRDSNNWFELALGRAPVELHATLQVR